jgi:hypothetical protein
MKAEEAIKIAFEHSERMQSIYKSITESAKRGNYELCLNTHHIHSTEMEVLRQNGFTATYVTSELDGGQMALIKWNPLP